MKSKTKQAHLPRVVSREKWLRERVAFLKREKTFTKRRDAHNGPKSGGQVAHFPKPAALVSRFAVEISLPRATLNPVPYTLSPQRKNRRQPKAAARKAFWARPANAELDRSGDWLLKNLTSTRAKAMSRAGPA